MTARQIAKAFREEASRLFAIAEILDPTPKPTPPKRKRKTRIVLDESPPPTTEEIVEELTEVYGRPAPTKEELRLNVVSSNHPTASELKDRELVHTSESPS